jgi:ubiquinone/menaquinone biosynthesis C-methylase UbiE
MRMRVVLSWCDGTSRVLDVGCGDGKLAAALNQKGCEVIGCDISIEQLRLGMETSKSVHFVRADAAHMPLRSGSLDIVFAGEVIEHMQNAFESLLEWRRLLKRRGSLILSTPNNLSLSRICQHLAGIKPGIWDLHLNFYDYYSIQQLLNFSGYHLREILTIRVPIPCFGLRLQALLARINPAVGETIVVRCQVAGF